MIINAHANDNGFAKRKPKFYATTHTSSNFRRDPFQSQERTVLRAAAAGLKKAGIKDIPGDIEQLMRDVDSDGSGVIDYTEFVAATLDKRQYIQVSTLTDAGSRQGILFF